MATAARILSIQVGLPRERQHHDSPWTTGIFKDPVSGPVRATADGLSGDGQADPRFHGGPDRAILLYSKANYPTFEAIIGRPIPPGGFGENFTLDALNEDEVCLGDIWVTDRIRIEVSQPRLPCYKLGRRLDAPEIVKAVMDRRRGGWYARVLTEGVVEPGDELRLVDRPFPQWSISKAFHNFLTGQNEAELGSIPALSALWRDRLLDS